VRFLFTSTPLDGHVRPLLPLAEALRRRGHEVAFATHESFHDHLADEGYAAFAAGTSHAQARRLLETHRAEIDALAPLERRPLIYPILFGHGHAPHKLGGLLRAAREWQPDALVWESSDIAAPIAASALGLPAVHHAFGAMVPLAAFRRCEDAVLPLWSQVGAEPLPYVGAFSGLYVDTCPPSLAWEQPLGETMRLAPATTPPGSPPPWLAELERPLVYATLGTVFNEPGVFAPLLAASPTCPPRFSRSDATSIPPRSGPCLPTCGSSGSCRRPTSSPRAPLWSPTLGRARRSPRSRTACRSCSYPKAPTSSRTRCGSRTPVQASW
jgi:UDP:flavonoid glycosyltransferase YjiC (YdhE family)